MSQKVYTGRVFVWVARKCNDFAGNIYIILAMPTSYALKKMCRIKKIVAAIIKTSPGNTNLLYTTFSHSLAHIAVLLSVLCELKKKTDEHFPVYTFGYFSNHSYRNDWLQPHIMWGLWKTIPVWPAAITYVWSNRMFLTSLKASFWDSRSCLLGFTLLVCGMTELGGCTLPCVTWFTCGYHYFKKPNLNSQQKIESNLYFMNSGFLKPLS